MPERIKHALSNASGRSVDVRIHTAGKGWPTDVKSCFLPVMFQNLTLLQMHSSADSYNRGIQAVHAESLSDQV